MSALESKVKVGKYILVLRAAQLPSGHWRAGYEIRPGLLSGVAIEGPTELDRTYERAQEAMAAAGAAGRRSIRKLAGEVVE